MKKSVLVIVLFIGTLSLWCRDRGVKYYLPNDFVTYDSLPYMVYDQFFEEAYTEIAGMIDGLYP